MSALSPHIRVLRAEAAGLSEQAAGFKPASPEHMLAKMLLLSQSSAKLIAADALEAEERKLDQQIRSGGSA